MTRTVWAVGAGMICAAMMVPAQAQAPTGIKALLGRASDAALGKLEKPGAFQADQAIRIVLPGPLGKLSTLLKPASKAGLPVNLDKAMNDAAGIAAGAAKPVFRSAIDKMTLTDGIGIATGGGTAATDYLKRSSGTVLQGQLRPLVESALRKTGAFGQLEKLATSSTGRMLGLNVGTLTNSVTEQTANGIFHYMGTEEAAMRRNPLGLGKAILDGVR